MYVYKDIEVEIELNDVLDYITDYASTSDIKSIKEAILDEEYDDSTILSSNEGSYIQEEKQILLNMAFKKYSLQELEERLGTKFDII